MKILVLGGGTLNEKSAADGLSMSELVKKFAELVDRDYNI